MKGKLIIFSAPSGSGKTSIVRALLDTNPLLEFSVSATSRPKRPGEVDGKDYYFLSPEEFREKIQQGLFLEWEEVYPDSFYGTLHSELKRIWEKGKHVVFDVDVIGGLNIKKQYPSLSLAVFIQPPSLKVLKTRLINRKTETKESLDKRLGKARLEMSFADKFDRVIINDRLEQAIQEAQSAVNDFIHHS